MLPGDNDDDDLMMTMMMMMTMMTMMLPGDGREGGHRGALLPQGRL